jgi:hypothetical protein
VRTANRLLATLIALVLLFAGLLVAIEIAFAQAGADPVLLPHHRWYRALRDAEWSDPSTRVVLGLMVAIGLALLVFEALKRRPSTLSSQPGESARYEFDRRSLEASLRRTAQSLDGVDRARARARPGTLDVTARASRSLAPEAEPRLDGLVNTRVDELELDPDPTVRVKIKSDFDS